MMWRQSPSSCLVLSMMVSGSLLASWDMTVSPVVTVPRGEDAVLSCSFTHPRQQHYSGRITVKWMKAPSPPQVFFSCSVRNNSADELGECSPSGPKHSLRGDPRHGELSLLIREAQLADNGTYVCRVELDSWWESFERRTHLYVAAQPQILSLSVVETSSGSDSAPRRLQCDVEGHPLPSVTWLSASSGPLGEQVRTSALSPFRLVSSVPYLEEDVLTCRAESRLGGAERRFPDSNALTISLSVCGLVVLLLLLTGFTCYLRNRAQETPVHENTEAARADTFPIYGNAEVVENHRLRGSDSPAEGAVEPQLIYSTLTLTSSLNKDLDQKNCTSRNETFSPGNEKYRFYLNDATFRRHISFRNTNRYQTQKAQHAAFKKSTQQQESEVLYSPVKIQQ